MDMHKEINYLGWTIYGWEKKRWGVFYPNGENSGKLYPSFQAAKTHIQEIEKALAERR